MSHRRDGLQAAYPSPTEGRPGFLQVLALMNKAAGNILALRFLFRSEISRSPPCPMQSPVWRPGHLCLWGLTPSCGLLGSFSHRRPPVWMPTPSHCVTRISSPWQYRPCTRPHMQKETGNAGHGCHSGGWTPPVGWHQHRQSHRKLHHTAL